MLLWDRLKVIGIASTFMVGYACSSKTAIDSSALQITNHANTSKQLAQDISETTKEPDTAFRADEITEHQNKIIDTASEIRTHLLGVSDTTPWWARLLQQGFIAIAIIGVIVLLWQTGIGMFIKRIFWSMGLFIPKRTWRSAEVDIKVIDEHNPLSFRESVAVRRASDPAYEYARRKLKKRKPL